MSQLVRRLLGLLFTLGFYDKHYKLVWDGEITSTNVFYEARHWSVRSGLKQKYKKIFEVLLKQAKVKPLGQMSLVIFFHSRHDCDNLSIMGKMLVDTMKGKYIENDTNKYYTSTHAIFDNSLPKGVVEFHLIGR